MEDSHIEHLFHQKIKITVQFLRANNEGHCTSYDRVSGRTFFFWDSTAIQSCKWPVANWKEQTIQPCQISRACIDTISEPGRLSTNLLPPCYAHVQDDN